MKNLEIVLFNPQIPQNTGNIGRLAVNTSTKLHLIKPMCFTLDEKQIKRAGMDYWQHIDLEVHESWDDFIVKHSRESLFFFSTKTDKLFWDCDYNLNSECDEPTKLIFGSESFGLSKEIYEEYQDRLYTIPMFGDHCRSYNLANSVSIVLFDAIRKALSK